MALSLDITRRSRVPFPAARFQLLARRVIKTVRPTLAKEHLSLSLAWVSDAQIRKINATYRGKDSATDVLSFSFLERGRLPIDGGLGELIISVDTLKRQAKEQGHTQTVEADVLFVHGLLHILGFDHERKADLKKMLAWEKVFLGDKAGLISRSLSASKKGSQ